MNKITDDDRKQLSREVMIVMSRHVGQNNAISMADLHNRIFSGGFNDKINDTRLLRRLITELRDEGAPICSSYASEGGGYYLSAAGSEAQAYCKRLRSQALRMLAREAAIRKISVPELLGTIQTEINLGGKI